MNYPLKKQKEQKKLKVHDMNQNQVSI